MRLEVYKVKIENVCFSEKTHIEGTTLSVSKDEIVRLIKEDNHIKDVDVDLVKPGDSVRIIPVKDVVQARVKLEGDIFPGMLSKTHTVGSGKTKVLEGLGIVTTGDVVAFQEGIIDMTGVGAEYTPFSKLNNIVLSFKFEDGLEAHDKEKAVRMAGLKVAQYIGEAARHAPSNDKVVYEHLPLLESVKKYPNLPKVAYVQMLQSQGLMHDTYVYGVDAKNIVPTIISPTEIMDGAIVSGNCVSACDKNTTYHHQNNPVIEDLYEEHGKTINFVGVILTNENVFLADKIRSSDWSAKLAEFLGLDGVIISQEGFGNPDTDLIMNCKKIEEKGIKTVIITDEYAGRDGASQSLADADKLADAVVTAGNANGVVRLPKLDRVIGNQNQALKIAGGSDHAILDDGSLEVEIQAITGATNELGFSYLSAKTY